MAMVMVVVVTLCVCARICIYDSCRKFVKKKGKQKTKCLYDSNSVSEMVVQRTQGRLVSTVWQSSGDLARNLLQSEFLALLRHPDVCENTLMDYFAAPAFLFFSGLSGPFHLHAQLIRNLLGTWEDWGATVRFYPIQCS